MQCLVRVWRKWTSGTHMREQTCAVISFVSRAIGPRDHRRMFPWGSEGQPSGTHGRTPWCSYIQGMFSSSHSLSILHSDFFCPTKDPWEGLLSSQVQIESSMRVSFSISRWVAQCRLNMWWSSCPRYCQAPVDFTAPDSQAEGSFVKKNSTPEAWSWGCMLDAVFPEHLFQMTKSQRALWAWRQRHWSLNAGFQS